MACSSGDGIFNCSDLEVLNCAIYFSGSLSIVSSGGIIFTYLLFPNTRTFGTKLIFFLSVSDFFSSFGWFPWNVTSTLCWIQASVLQFFITASFLWTFSISLSLFQVFYLGKEEEPKMNSFLYYHLFNWGFPFVTVVICLCLQNFGSAGSWCWIRDPLDFFRLSLYGSALLSLLFTVIAFFAIHMKIRDYESDFRRKLNEKLSFYLLAFLASQLPAWINRIQNMLYPKDPIFTLYFLQALFQPARGFFNAIVYGFTEQQFIDHYRIMFESIQSRYFCDCCRKRKVSKKSEEVPFFDYDYISDEEDK